MCSCILYFLVCQKGNFPWGSKISENLNIYEKLWYFISTKETSFWPVCNDIYGIYMKNS